MSASNRATSAQDQAGFGLIELMIGLTLGLMVTAVITSIFLSSNKSYQEDDQLARTQESGRFAIKLLVEDLSMAGMWGTLTPGVTIATNIANQPCGIPLNANNLTGSLSNPNVPPLRIVNRADASAANSAFDCISADEYYEDADTNARADVLLIKRTKGTNTTSNLGDRPVYLVQTSSPVGGQVAQVATPQSWRTYWEYIAHVYYIRNYSVTPGDGIPTLCRKTLVNGAGGPAMSTEPLIEGVENFQIEFGFDNPAQPAAIDWYTDDPSAETTVPVTATLPRVTRVVNARVYLLMRTLNKDASYTNKKSYVLGRTVIGRKDDRYHRRVFSTVVSLRNINSAAAYN